MKKIIFGLALLSSSSFASDIHLQNHEVAKVVVEGCKISEYGIVSATGNMMGSRGGDAVVAECSPKICQYDLPAWFGSIIKLFPGGKVLAKTKNKAETRARLEEFIRTGVCAKADGIPPSM